MDEVIFSALVYKWEDNTCGPTAEIDLPAAEYALRDALEKVRDGEGGETMVSVERFGNFRFLRGHLGETQDLRALNALAHKLAALEEWQIDAFEGLVRIDERDGVELDVPRLYDLAASTDACQVLYDATDYASLGRFYAENDFVPELEDVPDRVWELLDFDAIGRKMAAEENGVFIGERGYVVRIGEIRERFGELDLTPREPEYAALMEVSCTDSGKSMFLALPCGKQETEDILPGLGAENWSDLSWRCADCRIPALRDAFSQEDVFGYANHAAKQIGSIPPDDLLMYKALIDASGCSDLSEAMKLLDSMGAYTFTRSYAKPEDVALDELSIILCKSDAETLRPFLDLHRYGEKLIEDQNISMTPYGAIERCDGEPIQAPRREQDTGGMNMVM